MISKMCFILALFLLQPLTAFAKDVHHPSPQQLELMFGIEEELRSGLAKKAFLGVTSIIPIAVHTLLPDASVSGIKPMMDMATTFTLPIALNTVDSIHNKKQIKFIENILAECKKNGKFDCIQDRTKIIFHDPTSGKEVGHLKIGRDPMVIEVTANPFKLKDLDGDMGEILEKSLYGISKKTGLHPAQVGNPFVDSFLLV
jgi:hypothetical protein